MKNTPLPLILVSISILLLVQNSAAQPLPSGHGYALIFPKSGDGFAANILRVEKDSLVVYSTDYKYLAKKDIGKIILHPKRESGKGFTIGSVLGVYAMNYWLGTANRQPGAFLWYDTYGSRYSTMTTSSGTLEVVGIALLGVAIGGGVGYLLDLGREANSELVFIFGGTPDMQTEQWEKVREAFEQKTVHGVFHVNISGGMLFPPVSHAYFNQLASAGYAMGGLNTTPSSGNFFEFSGGLSTSNPPGTNLRGYQNIQAPTDFNWLRSISLSYSLTDELQVGACYALLGQPSFIYSKDIQKLNDTGSFSSISTAFAGQRLDGRGYYATCGYYKYFGKNENFELELTGGIGIADMSFDLNGQYDFSASGFNFNLIQEDNFTIRKTYFSGMISASFTYFLYDSFSLGLKANYFYVGKATAPNMPLVFLNEQNLNFSTVDIGFTIGMHF